ncbi:MAG: SufE family protein [Pseudomonadota bacterium]
MELAEIVETFEFLDDWEDKYRFVIDLGKELPELPAADRTDAALVRGCQSQVWLHAELGSDGHLQLRMDSDAHIVRGLIAVVLAALDERPPAEVVDFDAEDLFTRLDLLAHLSPTRGNGLRAMLARIKGTAEAYATT